MSLIVYYHKMEKALKHINNNNNLVPAANLVGLAALAGFTIKTNIELNKKINNLEEELSNVKTNFNENNKRANIAFTRLNQKIEETSVGLRNQSNYLKKMTSDVTEEKIREVKEEEFISTNPQDEVSDALQVLMNRK